MNLKKLFTLSFWKNNRWSPFSYLSLENTKYLKLIVSLYPGIAAVILAFFKDPITLSTRLAKVYLSNPFENSSLTINWLVTLYWLSVFIWIILYFTFVTNESEASRKTTEKLKSAISRSPNPRIFEIYQLCYFSIMEQLSVIDKEKILEHTANFQNILKTICVLTESYLSRKDTDEIIGATIMLYIPVENNQDLIQKIKKKQDEWIHFKDKEIAAMDGILYLVPELTSERTDGNPSFSISLPVIFNTLYEKIVDENIPGAPRAVLEGDFLFSNVRDSNSYAHLGESEKKNAENYWNSKLPDVKSIISMGIPKRWDNEQKYKNNKEVIAVINVDSTKKNILGTETEYHTTYKSLLFPILCQLSGYMEIYMESYIKQLNQNYT